MPQAGRGGALQKEKAKVLQKEDAGSLRRRLLACCWSGVSLAPIFADPVGKPWWFLVLARFRFWGRVFGQSAQNFMGDSNVDMDMGLDMALAMAAAAAAVVVAAAYRWLCVAVVIWAEALLSPAESRVPPVNHRHDRPRWERAPFPPTCHPLHPPKSPGGGALPPSAPLYPICRRLSSSSCPD